MVDKVAPVGRHASTYKITDKNKNIPLTNEELESILQDEQFYDLFDDENNGSVIDFDHESIDSLDSNLVIKVTDNDDISDRNDEENSDDAFLDEGVIMDESTDLATNNRNLDESVE
ncbi:hypothetical protein FQA39_LY16743 [Lamprigera yunnana]|nr:hypothetical protein FQA39_LY16743 [Lamprigera yunnana]